MFPMLPGDTDVRPVCVSACGSTDRSANSHGHSAVRRRAVVARVATISGDQVNPRRDCSRLLEILDTSAISAAANDSTVSFLRLVKDDVRIARIREECRRIAACSSDHKGFGKARAADTQRGVFHGTASATAPQSVATSTSTHDKRAVGIQTDHILQRAPVTAGLAGTVSTVTGKNAVEGVIGQGKSKRVWLPLGWDVDVRDISPSTACTRDSASAIACKHAEHSRIIGV